MNNKNLYLVGVLHYDPDGSDRTTRILSTIQPEIIGIETSQDRLRNVLTCLSKQELESVAKRNMAQSGFELTQDQQKSYVNFLLLKENITGREISAAHAYSKLNPESKLECIDASVYTHSKHDFIRGIKELEETSMSKKDLVQILDAGPNAYIASLRVRCAKEYAKEKTIQDFYETLRTFENIEQIIRAREEPEPPKGLSECGLQAFHAIHNSTRDDTMARNLWREYQELEQGNIVAIVGLRHLLSLRYRLEEINPIVMTLDDAIEY